MLNYVRITRTPFPLLAFPAPSHAAAFFGRELVHRVVPVARVQKGNVIIVGQGAAAGPCSHFLLLDLSIASHILEGHVIGPHGRITGTAAVAEQDSLIRFVTQAQLAHRQLKLLEGAGFVVGLGPLHPVAGFGQEGQLVAS